ncbi:transporter associated domain-containing protein [Paracoccus sp. p4-l81]|uniref:transporter associated domain-containing protein n=1 Tax=Paracoccus sp. p4-l81 TaxID=3342806 RepID=UPI0035BB70ED
MQDQTQSPATTPAPAGSDPADEGDSRPPREGRNLFSRLRGVFSPPDAETDEPPPPRPADQPGLMNLRAKRVDDVAIPKVEITAVPVTIGKDDLVEVFREHGYSRIPVFKGTLDSPLGLIHLKDLALTHGFGTPGKRFSLRSLLRPLLFVPPSMPIGVLLQKMQAQRIHMALVIDEYGGVDGLITLEDLVEQVIGEIDDEHDEAEDNLWKQEKPGQYLVQARAPLADFETEIGMALVGAEDAEEVDTLGGLVFKLTGRVPARGEVIPHDTGAEFEVVDADLRRIKRLRVRLPDGAASVDAGAA